MLDCPERENIPGVSGDACLAPAGRAWCMCITDTRGGVNSLLQPYGGFCMRSRSLGAVTVGLGCWGARFATGCRKASRQPTAAASVLQHEDIQPVPLVHCMRCAFLNCRKVLHACTQNWGEALKKAHTAYSGMHIVVPFNRFRTQLRPARAAVGRSSSRPARFFQCEEHTPIVSIIC